MSRDSAGPDCDLGAGDSWHPWLALDTLSAKTSEPDSGARLAGAGFGQRNIRTRHMWRAGGWKAGAVLLALVGCLVIGCEPLVRQTRLDLTVFEQDGRQHHHYTDFSAASYELSPGGTLELVLRSERPSSLDPTQTITQILYLKTFWQPMPGTTYVEASQINARVQYAMLTSPTGVRYDGGAFISFSIDKRTGILTGRIESGSLAPRFRMGDAVEPFGAARFTGTVRATERPRDVVNTLQMLESQFSQPIENAPAAGP